MAADDTPTRARIVRLFLFLLVTILALLAPTSLFYGEGLCAQTTLAWDPSNAPDLGGYKLYYGMSSGSYSFVVDAGTQTTYTVTGLNRRYNVLFCCYGPYYRGR